MTTKLNEELLAGYGDDALAEIAEAMLAESKILRHNADSARFELRRRLIDRGATHVDTDNWQGRLVPGSFDHRVEDPEELLLALQAAGVAVERIREAVAYTQPAPTWRVNHRELNELMKLGGDVRAAIETHRQSVRRDPELDLHRKAEVEAVAP